MTHDEMIELIAAHRDGKTIEMRHAGGWIEVANPIWNFHDFNYRIKPGQREWFLVINAEGDPAEAVAREVDADGYASDYGGRVVKVREVLENES